MDEDEGGFGGMYEDGHWEWDEQAQALIFVSDLPPALVEVAHIITKAPTGTIEFRDDIDLIEQLRYRRRYQRKLKPGEPDLVNLQDIKDVALYTAPINILSPMLIDMLHLPTTERFLRALIFCCAYYLQIAEEMSLRAIELTTKIRTPNCEIVENEYRDNLSDLRILVATEYCVMLIGGGDTKKFHHMGPYKKRRSLSDKDARLYETFIRISVQIVYLALGRKNFNLIELECCRIFKSEIFNSAEHMLKTGYLSHMTPEEQAVLLGPCLHHDKKLNTRSPLSNEIFCHRPIDFRLMGLGVVKYENINNRLQYLYLVVAGSGESLVKWNMTVGIIGIKRTQFDTMLRPIGLSTSDAKSRSSISSQSGQTAKTSSALPKSMQALQRFYPIIVMPVTDKFERLPSDFPQTPADVPLVSTTQRRRWHQRYIRLTKPTAAS